MHNCDIVLHNLSCYTEIGAILAQLIPLGVWAAREEGQEVPASGFLHWRTDFGRPQAAAPQTATTLEKAFRAVNRVRESLSHSTQAKWVAQRPKSKFRVDRGLERGCRGGTPACTMHVPDLAQLPGTLLWPWGAGKDPRTSAETSPTSPLLFQCSLTCWPRTQARGSHGGAEPSPALPARRTGFGAEQASAGWHGVLPEQGYTPAARQTEPARTPLCGAAGITAQRLVSQKVC